MSERSYTELNFIKYGIAQAIRRWHIGQQLQIISIDVIPIHELCKMGNFFCFFKDYLYYCNRMPLGKHITRVVLLHQKANCLRLDTLYMYVDEVQQFDIYVPE